VFREQRKKLNSLQSLDFEIPQKQQKVIKIPAIKLHMMMEKCRREVKKKKRMKKYDDGI
jgi:hypothetical protein